MASSFSFNIDHTNAARAIWFRRYFHIRALHIIRIVSYWVFWIALAVFIFVFVGDESSEAKPLQQALLGIVFILFSYIAAIAIFELFGKSLTVNKRAKSSNNLAHALSFEAAEAVHNSVQFAKHGKLTELTSTIVFYNILKADKRFRLFFLNRLLLDEKDTMQRFEKAIFAKGKEGERPSTLMYMPSFQDAYSAALTTSAEKHHEYITLSDLVDGISATDPVIKEIVLLNNFAETDIQHITTWYYSVKERIAHNKKFWLKDNLRKKGSLAKGWASGYTITLDAYSVDITDSARRQGFPQSVGHAAEKEALSRALSRERVNNALLVGEPGVGRKHLLLDFASKSALGKHKNSRLNYQRVVQLELPLLLSSLESREQVEGTLEQVFKEILTAGNVILVIDDIHNYVGGQSAEDAVAKINISGIIASYLRSPQFPLIGLTTYSGLHRYLEQNTSILSFFEKIEIQQVSAEETISILIDIVPRAEKVYKRFVSYPALKAIISYADRYIQAVPFPKKAIDLLDEATIAVAQSNDKILLPEHVASIVKEKTGIPVGEAEDSERELLLDLENLIHQRLIGQDAAVTEVATAMRRARAEVSVRGGPMGSFLFLGPTGVGKTETAKALAAIYFGSESRIIRLDMSEFQSIQDIPRLLGGNQQDGLLTTPIRENPFSLLLLDELEKAHPNILNLFLQVLDEGHITDGLGRRIDFRHTIIIATSNAGYQLILSALREGKDFSVLKQEMLNYIFEEGIYRPEFVNRFDGVVLFKPLGAEELLQISGLMLKKLQKNLDEKGITFIITEELKAKIAELGYDPTFGARNMTRIIQEHVENAFASALLSRAIQKGDRVQVNPETFVVEKIHNTQ